MLTLVKKSSSKPKPIAKQDKTWKDMFWHFCMKLCSKIAKSMIGALTWDQSQNKCVQQDGIMLLRCMLSCLIARAEPSLLQCCNSNNNIPLGDQVSFTTSVD